MDLLRLVFARQTVDSIVRFPGLLRSRVFRKIRGAILGYTPGNDIVQDTTSIGEISKTSMSYTIPDVLLSRAIFLRDTASIVDLAGKADSLDFWLLLESDIPEAQAAALAAFVYLKQNQMGDHQMSGKVLENYNDLTSINWTPRLKFILSSLIGRGRGNELTGYLLLPSHPFSLEEYVGLCKAVLGGKEIMEYNERLSLAYTTLTRDYTQDAYVITGSVDVKKYKCILRSGYLYPLLEKLKSPEYHVVKSALKYASRLALKMIAESEEGRRLLLDMHLAFPGNLACTKWYRKRVQAIVDDTSLLKYLPEDYTGWYRIVLGEVASDWSKFDGLNILGIAMEGGTENFDNLHKLRISSLQGITFYDPDGLLRASAGKTSVVDFLIRDAYRRGKYFRQFDESAEFHDKVPVEIYRAVLAYLKGESRTWDPSVEGQYTIIVDKTPLYIFSIKATEIHDTLRQISDQKFWSLSRYRDEYTLVSQGPSTDPDAEKWVKLTVKGPLPFNLIGIIANISKLLADNKISVYVISDYNNDHVLINPRHLDNAIKVLETNYIIE